ncbi:hypothetical protein PCE1_004547 [Barthelona sp. PCE]
MPPRRKQAGVNRNRDNNRLETAFNRIRQRSKSDVLNRNTSQVRKAHGDHMAARTVLKKHRNEIESQNVFVSGQEMQEYDDDEYEQAPDPRQMEQDKEDRLIQFLVDKRTQGRKRTSKNLRKQNQASEFALKQQKTPMQDDVALPDAKENVDVPLNRIRTKEEIFDEIIARSKQQRTKERQQSENNLEMTMELNDTFEELMKEMSVLPMRQSSNGGHGEMDEYDLQAQQFSMERKLLPRINMSKKQELRQQLEDVGIINVPESIDQYMALLGVGRSELEEKALLEQVHLNVHPDLNKGDTTKMIDVSQVVWDRIVLLMKARDIIRILHLLPVLAHFLQYGSSHLVDFIKSFKKPKVTFVVACIIALSVFPIPSEKQRSSVYSVTYLMISQFIAHYKWSADNVPELLRLYCMCSLLLKSISEAKFFSPDLYCGLKKLLKLLPLDVSEVTEEERDTKKKLSPTMLFKRFKDSRFIAIATRELVFEFMSVYRLSTFNYLISKGVNDYLFVDQQNQIGKWLKLTQITRKPLTYQTFKPIPIPSKIPVIKDNYGSVEEMKERKTEEQRLKKALKRVTKRTIKELKRDTEFIQREKFKKIQQTKKKFEKEQKAIYAELSKNQEEFNKYDRSRK